MRYSIVLKAIDWGCFSVFIFGGAVVVYSFLLELKIFEVTKTAIGVAVVFGWLATIIAALIFVLDAILWFIGKAPWFWKSLAPLNFSFVLLVISLFAYNKNMGFMVPVLIVACAFVAAWLVVANKIHEKKPFLFVVAPALVCCGSYHVPLFLGGMLLFVSIFARRGLRKET